MPRPDSADFFSQVISGSFGKPDRAESFETLHTISNPQSIAFIEARRKYLGQFDDHIRCSIPGFYEAQANLAAAILALAQNKSSRGGPVLNLLDIGCTDGSFLKGIVELGGGLVSALGLDPNPEAWNFFVNGSAAVPGAEFQLAAFCDPSQRGDVLWLEHVPHGLPINIDENGMVPIVGFDPPVKYDVVHEAMTFQFISDKRREHIEWCKDVLEPNGVLMLHEKCQNDLWLLNETAKDYFKSQYFLQQSITEKAGTVLAGMHQNLIEFIDLRELLKQAFECVACYWHAGNFFGFIATNSNTEFEIIASNIEPNSARYSNIIFCRL